MNRLIVIGAGGIGGTIAGLIAATGVEVVLVQRGDHHDAITQHGLYVATCLGHATHHLRCVRNLAELTLTFDDHVLVAVKLYDAEAVYAQLRNTPATVIVGQNGVHGSRWATASCERVISTMVWIPAEFLEPGKVRAYGYPVPGRVDVGPNGADVRDALRAAGLTSDLRGPIEPWIHAKWLTNLAGLAHSRRRPEHAEALVSEGRHVLETLGIPHMLDALYETVAPITLTSVDGRQRLPGGSSMQSLQRGRRSEVEWLNGELVRLARQAEVPTPAHDQLLK